MYVHKYMMYVSIYMMNVYVCDECIYDVFCSISYKNKAHYHVQECKASTHIAWEK